ncbi:MAG: hypothetical protein EXS13_06695 [Planctomycetes bacterium]|nr:hypothetical protein [Planctomycetota bacterium]
MPPRAALRATPASATVARVSSQRCRFEPHLLALQVGQSVDFVQVDPTVQNFHLLPQVNDELNFAIALPGGKKRMAFDHPEPGFIKLKSDINPWMSAWIAVLPHPWFAVTGADGRYAIDGVPAGRHTPVLRHPTLGEKRVAIVVEAARETTQAFTLRQ